MYWSSRGTCRDATVRADPDQHRAADRIARARVRWGRYFGALAMTAGCTSLNELIAYFFPGFALPNMS